MAADQVNVDPQLWHACAGSLVHIPTPNSTAYYFPQGHVENAQVITTEGFSDRPQILCRVESVKFLAKPDTDEVCAKFRLIPLPNDNNPLDSQDTGVSGSQSRSSDNSANSVCSFGKILTQSDANGGGFSVPTAGAKRVFPPLDYQDDPPAQTLVVKDIHGRIWNFRHVYRGNPKRHMLQGGWSPFVNEKKLVAGDLILFYKSENGDLSVGIRRAQRKAVGFVSGLSDLCEKGNEKAIRMMASVNEKAEAVMQVVALASSGQVFDVDYFPAPNKPEFVVNAAIVRAAMEVQWRSGMRFKKAYEKEDTQQIRWDMGTVSAAQVVDQAWPNSLWKLLQVTWEEPHLQPNVKHVNPWSVELFSDLPKIKFSTLVDARFPGQSFLGNNLHAVTPTIRIQEARHASQCGSSSVQLEHSRNVSDTEKRDESGIQKISQSSLGNNLHAVTPTIRIQEARHASQCGSSSVQLEHSRNVSDTEKRDESGIGKNSQNILKQCKEKFNPIRLFGELIFTEQQIRLRNAVEEENRGFLLFGQLMLTEQQMRSLIAAEKKGKKRLRS